MQASRSEFGTRQRLAVGVVVLLVVIGAAVSAWLLMRPSPTGTQTSAPARVSDLPAPPAAEKNLARLQGLLPSGYSPGSCTAAQPPAKALAAMTCTTNTDPGGAGPAVYAITRGPAELRTALNESLRAVAVVTCPGNIQSPGPWRRNATPQQVRGTLVCGLRNGVPTIVWTTEADLLISRVDATASGRPALDQLYKWWSLHS